MAIFVQLSAKEDSSLLHDGIRSRSFQYGHPRNRWRNTRFRINRAQMLLRASPAMFNPFITLPWTKRNSRIIFNHCKIASSCSHEFSYHWSSTNWPKTITWLYYKEKKINFSFTVSAIRDRIKFCITIIDGISYFVITLQFLCYLFL